MKKELINKPEIKLVGLKVRTNNKNEINPATSKIGELVGQYKSRKSAGITYAVYTEYDSDEHGDYTYFIGEEVNSFDAIPSDMDKLIIPASRYVRLTTPEGKMPQVVIKAWQEIWTMTANDMGGDRAYIADFELYDQRASDPAHTSLDIYIGIK